MIWLNGTCWPNPAKVPVSRFSCCSYKWAKGSWGIKKKKTGRHQTTSYSLWSCSQVLDCKFNRSPWHHQVKQQLWTKGSIQSVFVDDRVGIWWLPGVVEGNLGCRNPGSAGCNLAVHSGACAGWTHYWALASSGKDEVYSCLLNGRGQTRLYVLLDMWMQYWKIEKYRSTE